MIMACETAAQELMTGTHEPMQQKHLWSVPAASVLASSETETGKCGATADNGSRCSGSCTTRICMRAQRHLCLDQIPKGDMRRTLDAVALSPPEFACSQKYAGQRAMQRRHTVHQVLVPKTSLLPVLALSSTLVMKVSLFAKSCRTNVLYTFQSNFMRSESP